jgi:hypothetical protein
MQNLIVNKATTPLITHLHVALQSVRGTDQVPELHVQGRVPVEHLHDMRAHDLHVVDRVLRAVG